MENDAVQKSVQMSVAIRFDAYDLEAICLDFSIDTGSFYFAYLCGEVLSCEMGNDAQGMEYSLVYLQSIIESMAERLKGYPDEVDDFETELLSKLRDFMKDKDEQLLVYIQGY